MKTINNLGQIKLHNYTISYGGKKLFSNPGNLSKTVGISFHNGKIYDNELGSSIMSDIELWNIEMSPEQWASSMININNKNGAPCTITRYNTKDGYVKSDSSEIENNENVWEKTLNDFQDEINALLPFFKPFLKEAKEIIYKDKILKSDKKRLEEIKNETLRLWNENLPKIEETINKYLVISENISQKEFINEVKNNFLSFLSCTDKENISKVLEHFKDDLLLEDKEPKKEKVLESYGVLTIETIDITEPLLEDEEATNGVRITLSSADFDYIDGVKIIVPKETLHVVEMSMSQWGNFLTSSSGGDCVCTNKFSKHFEIKNIDLPLFKLNKKIEDLNNYFNKVEETFSQYGSKIEEHCSKNIGKRKQRQVEIDFEVFLNHPLSNLSFYFNQVLKERVKNNISKRLDFQFSIQKRVTDLGIKKLNEEINNKGVEQLKLILPTKQFLIKDKN